MMRISGRQLRIAIRLAFIIALVAAAEAFIRAVRLPPGYFPRLVREEGLYIDHPTRGYTLKPGAYHRYVTPEVDIPIAISSDGLRDTTVAFARTAGYRVLSVGDSFTMGLGVAADDTWSEQLERMLNGSGRGSASVVNAGIPGYSARQVRLRMEDLLPLVRPNAVVYGLTAESYIRMLHPMVLYGGTLVSSRALPGLRITERGLLYSPYQHAWMRAADFWLNQHFHLGAHLLAHARRLYERLVPSAVPVEPLASLDPEQIRRDMQPAMDELAAMNREVVAQHIRFIVLIVNVQREDASFRPQDTIYNKVVADECRRDRITCIDMLPVLEQRAGGQPIFRRPHDQHWTPAAHALAAEALLSVLRKS